MSLARIVHTPCSRILFCSDSFPSISGVFSKTEFKALKMLRYSYAHTTRGLTLGECILYI